MIHWNIEGQRIHNGLSIYHPSDERSFGGCIRVGKRVWRVRYSKFSKKWFIGYQQLSDKTIKDWEDFANKI